MSTTPAADTAPRPLAIATAGARRRAAQLVERLRSWGARYEIDDAEDRWTFEQLVINSLRVDACRAREDALLTYESARAEASWDDDRRLQAEELGAALARRPAVVARRLATTAEGCRWLLRRWDLLARAEDWTDERRSLAFDLLGVARELRDGDPWASHGSAAAMVESERSRLSARLSGPLAAEEALARSMAESGVPACESAEMRRLRRDEAAYLRRYERARRRLAPRVAAGPSSSPAPRPAADPTPTPTRPRRPNPFASPAPTPLPAPDEPASVAEPVSAAAPASSLVPVSAAAPTASFVPVSATAPTASFVPVSATAPTSSFVPVSATVPTSSFVPVSATAPTAAELLEATGRRPNRRARRAALRRARAGRS